MSKHTLPAQTIEIPRMGTIVYVSPRTGMDEGKHTVMIGAEVLSDGRIELQTFHYRCDSQKEAERTRDVMRARLDGSGPFPFIQNKA